MTNSTERRTPAEWEPQRCIVAATPTRAHTWPMCLQQAQAQHAAMLDAIRHVTPVHPLDQLGITPGDAWLRDTGPVFTLENKQVRAVDFRTDHYGHSYPDIEPDDMVGEQLSAALQTPCDRRAFFTEGGAIETNGQGTALVTEPCLLDASRNPQHTTREAVEAELHDALGITRTLWLPRGLAGDDTGGHIDNLARFVSADHVLLAHTTHPDDRETIEASRALLRDAGLTVTDLPAAPELHYDYPQGLSDEPGRHRLAASYANFLITNGHVFTPAFGHPADHDAARLIAEATGLPTIPLRCEHLLVGGGTIHCLTCHVPKA